MMIVFIGSKSRCLWILTLSANNSSSVFLRCWCHSTHYCCLTACARHSPLWELLHSSLSFDVMISVKQHVVWRKCRSSFVFFGFDMVESLFSVHWTDTFSKNKQPLTKFRLKRPVVIIKKNWMVSGVLWYLKCNDTLYIGVGVAWNLTCLVFLRCINLVVMWF